MEQQDPKLGDMLAQKRTDLAGERTDLALHRTLMAAGRTLLAWVRTGMSMIGFGFTIYKILQAAQKEGIALTLRPQGPRDIGLFLIALGTFSALIGGLEYWSLTKSFWRDFKVRPRKFPLVAAALIFLLGLWLFIAIVLKAEYF